MCFQIFYLSNWFALFSFLPFFHKYWVLMITLWLVSKERRFVKHSSSEDFIISESIDNLAGLQCRQFLALLLSIFSIVWARILNFLDKVTYHKWLVMVAWVELSQLGGCSKALPLQLYEDSFWWQKYFNSSNILPTGL